MKRKAAEPSEDGGPERAAQFAAHLQSLNKQFASWVRQQAEEHGGELWVDGARAYARYADELTQEYEDVLQSTDAPAGKAGAAAPALAIGARSSSSPGGAGGAGAAFGVVPGGFTFGGASAAAAAPASSAAAAAPASSAAFAFGSGSSAPAFGGAASSSGGGAGGGGRLFGAAPAAGSAPMFAFGGAAAQPAAGAAPAATGFSFGAPPATTGFAFPAPAANGGAAAAADGGGGDDEDAAPKSYTPEISVNEETYEVFYSSKAKLAVYQKPPDGGAGTWEPRGIGLLSVRRFKEGADTKKSYIMFTTDTGKQLLYSAVLASTNIIKPKPDANGGAAKRVTGYLMARVEELPPSGKPSDDKEAEAAAAKETQYKFQNCMLTLGSADKVEEFCSAVEARKPAS